MAWIESHQELRKHPKTIKLAKLLGITTAESIGRLHMLWWWAVDYAPDGDLTRFDPVDIAIGMEWEGDPDQLIQALLECGHGDHAGFLERTADGRLLIHDWDEYAGRLIERRAKNAQRMRHKRAEHVDQVEDDTGGDRAQDVHGTCAARVRLPNLTKPNLTEQEKISRAPSGGADTDAADKPKGRSAKATDERVKPVIDHYARRFQEVFGRAPVIMGGRDGALIRRIPRQHEAQAICNLMDRWFDARDEPYLWRSGDIPSFVAVFNELLSRQRQRDPGKRSGMDTELERLLATPL